MNDDLIERLRREPRIEPFSSNGEIDYRPSMAHRAADALDRLRTENERLREALTPSADTKAAYMGEFHMGITLRHPRTGEEDRRRAQIPWDTIKEIMAAIRARAALKTDGGANDQT